MRALRATIVLLAALAVFGMAASGVRAAEQVVAGLSQNRVALTANFDGSEILIFGAIKRDTPAPEGAPMAVVVTLAAPSRDEVVRRKARVLGLWVNRDSVRIDAAPPFYAVATSGPLGEIVSQVEDMRHSISIPRTIRAVGASASAPDAPAFVEALMRLRAEDGLYAYLPGAVTVTAETLFETRITLPANLVEGEYLARIFLLRDRVLVDRFETTITVQKVGLGRWIYSLAHELPLVYGLLSIFLAIAAGWLAAAAFRLFRT